ncbi:MAG: L,D-transpeptidase YbiS [Ulvibacter sp.]|jgi:L,D-transpeptidase YbiS
MRIFKLIFFFIFLCQVALAGDKNPPTEMSPRLEISIVLDMKYPSFVEGKLIYVSVDRQKLYVLYNNEIIKDFDVSTSKYGTGTTRNSNKTPLGLHLVASKVGEGDPINTIYKSRMNTGKKAVPNQAKFVNDDLITTRIMWLEGGEESNALGKNSSFKRYIYIHGTPDEMGLGYTASHGCVRMRNTDILGLYEYVELGTPVLLWQNDPSYNKEMSKGLKKEKKKARKLNRKKKGYQNLRINY